MKRQFTACSVWLQHACSSLCVLLAFHVLLTLSFVVDGLHRSTRRLFRRPVIECSSPGCGRWFRRQSGYTKHYNTFHKGLNYAKGDDDLGVIEAGIGMDGKFIYPIKKSPYSSSGKYVRS